MSDSIHSILTAIDFAARKHKHQRRKGRDEEPYINHPIEVARLIRAVGGVDDIDILVAAVLHDTVEDTDTTEEELTKIFGARAASFVMEVTDDKTLDKAERKRHQVEHAPHLSPEAKIIKLADKISNIEDIIANPPEGWDTARKLEYVQWGRDVIAGLTGANPPLESMFEELTDRTISEFKQD